MLILSIDFGTSAVKMSVLDDSLNTLAHASGKYRYIILPGERNELRADDLLSAMKSAASSIDPSLLSGVELLCYDTFSPSPVLMDEDGSLAYPNIITHLDRRARAQCDYIDRTFGRDAYMAISGIYPFAGGCSAMTLIWLREHAPEALSKTYRIGHLPTYIHHLLTGLWAVDRVNASMLGLYDTVGDAGWSDALISSFGLERRWFGQIYAPGTHLGTLLPSMAAMLGVRAGIPVAVGTNDVAAAQVGAGNRAPGRVMNTAGSSEMVSILTDKPATSPHYYLRCAATPGLWQIYATTAGGFAVDWFREQFCRELDEPAFYAYVASCIDRLASAPSEVSFDPYLSGDRQSMVRRTASWHGLTLASDRDEMLFSLLASMQDVLYDAVRRAAAVVQLDPLIRISGGMTTPEYLRLKRSRFPGFDFLLVDDCPIRGNALLALG